MEEMKSRIPAFHRSSRSVLAKLSTTALTVGSLMLNLVTTEVATNLRYGPTRRPVAPAPLAQQVLIPPFCSFFQLL